MGLLRITRATIGKMAFYFAYGTLQKGFPNHARFARRLGPPLGRGRTVVPYPLVLPARPACSNPGCPLEHRMCVLLAEPGRGHRIEGDVYDIDASVLEALDELEGYRADAEGISTFLRRELDVELLEGKGRLSCAVYVIADATPYRALLDRGLAEMVACYELPMAEGRLKRCCRENPGHGGEHDTSEPWGEAQS